MGQHVCALPGVAIPEAGKFRPPAALQSISSGSEERVEGGGRIPYCFSVGETVQKQLKKSPFPLQKSAWCGARRGMRQLGKGTAHRDGGH